MREHPQSIPSHPDDEGPALLRANLLHSTNSQILRTVEFETNITFGEKTLVSRPDGFYVISRIEHFDGTPTTYFISDSLTREEVLRINEFANLVA